MPMAVSLGPDQEFQSAIVTALNASADIKTLIGDPPRIYETVPTGAKFPYLALGESQNVPDLADCIDAATVYADLHIWSVDSGFAECQSIAATALAVITAATLTMTQNRCVDCMSNGIRYLRDPDGITRHAVLTIKGLVDPT